MIKRKVKWLSDKGDFRTRTATRDKEGRDTMIKGPDTMIESTLQKGVTILNVYVPSNRASK